MPTPVRHIPEQGHKLLVYFKKTSERIPLTYELMLQIRRAIRETLCSEGFAGDAEVSFTCCDNAGIRRLNRDYRHKDAATDVLSFPLEDGTDETEPEGVPVALGDIVVSYERAAEQAAELGHSTEREIVFLTVHSVLHLLGYDHETSTEDEEDMCRRQREIVRRLYPGEGEA